MAYSVIVIWNSESIECIVILYSSLVKCMTPPTILRWSFEFANLGIVAYFCYFVVFYSCLLLVCIGYMKIIFIIILTLKIIIWTYLKKTVWKKKLMYNISFSYKKKKIKKEEFRCYRFFCFRLCLPLNTCTSVNNAKCIKISYNIYSLIETKITKL